MINNNHEFLKKFCPRPFALRSKTAGTKFRGGYSSGFTLIELLIVVLVVAIITALSMPIFIKNIEKVKTGEAANNLNLIRMAEKEYFLYNQAYTLSFSSLNIDNPNDLSTTNRYFTYTIPTGNAAGFTATATRKDGPYENDSYTIDQNGVITSNGHFQL